MDKKLFDMEFEQLLEYVNPEFFYKEVKTHDDLKEFIKIINRAYCKKINKETSVINYSEKRVSPFVDALDNENNKINIPVKYFKFLDEMIKQKNIYFCTHIFDIVIHENTHLQQLIMREKILNDPLKYSEKDRLIALAISIDIAIQENLRYIPKSLSSALWVKKAVNFNEKNYSSLPWERGVRESVCKEIIHAINLPDCKDLVADYLTEQWFEERNKKTGTYSLLEAINILGELDKDNYIKNYILTSENISLFEKMGIDIKKYLKIKKQENLLKDKCYNETALLSFIKSGVISETTENIEKLKESIKTKKEKLEEINKNLKKLIDNEKKKISRCFTEIDKIYKTVKKCKKEFISKRYCQDREKYDNASFSNEAESFFQKLKSVIDKEKN